MFSIFFNKILWIYCEKRKKERCQKLDVFGTLFKKSPESAV